MAPAVRRLGAYTVGAVLLAVVGLTGCGGLRGAESVTMLAVWTGTEAAAFKKVTDAFTAETGIRVEYQGTRAVNEVLLSLVRKGDPPDVAALWSPSELAKYARSGDLRPLDGVIDLSLQSAYGRQWLLPRTVHGREHIYTVPLKANLKGVVWYDPARFPWPAPRTWAELIDRSRRLAAGGTAPWCVGMADTPASGWPGTDWIEDVLLYQSGVDVYTRWATGRLAWTSDEVRRAWTTWGDIVTGPGFINGGRTAALLTSFPDAGLPMFENPPGCFMEHEPSFIIDSYRKAPLGSGGGGHPRAGVDYSFFQFPAFGPAGAPQTPGAGAPQTGAGPTATGGSPDAASSSDRPVRLSADLAGMFHDTPAARRFIRFLASEEAQRIWPALPGSSAFSLNTRLRGGPYGDNSVNQRIARLLTASGADKCFDASDTFPAIMRNAFNQAILEYLSDPKRLPTLLEELERIRSTIGQDEWQESPCGH